MPRNKIQRNLDHLLALTKVIRTESRSEYLERLEYLRSEGWEIQKTPRCHDFAAAQEALEGAAR